MDSITQAALGALCGEMVLGRQLGCKGALWGLFFGTLPDLDVIAFYFQTASEQLMWHRGLSHSILLMFVGAFVFGALLKKIHWRRQVSYWRFFAFVFLAWSTHVLIDCFNTYGTQIMEPFSDIRYTIGNISIIDLFFLVPMLIGLFLAVIVFRKRVKLRSRIGWLTTLWLCFYFGASLLMKHFATQHFDAMLAKQGIEVEEIVASPTISNIFLWRMHARDKDGYYVSYWSAFDDEDREPVVRQFEHGHELERGFEDSIDLQRLKWFCQGWHKTFKVEGEPESIYVAAINMSEVHLYMPLPKEEGEQQMRFMELRPSFIWKITKQNGDYQLERPFKMSKDGGNLLKEAVKLTYQRVKGEAPKWMDGVWSWDIHKLPKQAARSE